MLTKWLLSLPVKSSLISERNRCDIPQNTATFPVLSGAHQFKITNEHFGSKKLHGLDSQWEKKRFLIRRLKFPRIHKENRTNPDQIL